MLEKLPNIGKSFSLMIFPSRSRLLEIEDEDSWGDLIETDSSEKSC
jgi:hypothetical protein